MPGFGSSVFFREVPLFAVLVPGGQVQGEARHKIHAWQQLEHLRYSWCAIDFGHQVSQLLAALTTVAFLAASKLPHDPHDLSVNHQKRLRQLLVCPEQVENGLHVVCRGRFQVLDLINGHAGRMLVTWAHTPGRHRCGRCPLPLLRLGLAHQRGRGVLLVLRRDEQLLPVGH